MAGESVKVGENRYRERFGRYFEDFEVGATYEHRPGRTISETDNTWFALLTMNQHPIHFDAEYAKHTEFGKPLVVSTLTLSILVGMSVSDTSQKAIANLGWEKITLPKPVFAGTRCTPNRPCSRNASPNPARTRASSRSGRSAAINTARSCASSSAPCSSCGAATRSRKRPATKETT